MPTSIPVSTIMTKNIIALSTSDDLQRAEVLFKRHQIKHMPVVAKGTVVGMLSYTDLMRISCPETAADTDTVETVVFNMFSIEQVMEKNVITISIDASIREATNILASNSFNSLPVVDSGVLVGIVTTTDLLNYYLKAF